jgi:hypothetical protein
MRTKMLVDGPAMLNKAANSPLMNSDEWRLHCELTDAVRQRCREDSGDLGSNMSIARLAFDATVRRMKSSAR